MIDRNLSYAVAGCGTGIVAYYLGKNFGSSLPLIPFLPSPWNGWCGWASIIGGLLTAFSFTKYVRTYQYFLAPFGISMLVNGIMEGIMQPASASARMRVMPRATRVMPRYNANKVANSNLTPTSIPMGKVLA